jgi:hypothetical protein
MNKYKSLWTAAAVSALAAASAGCHQDNGEGGAGPEVVQPTSFTAFTKSTFAAPANGTPVPIEFINFVFDADDDPTAFNALLN